MYDPRDEKAYKRSKAEAGRPQHTPAAPCSDWAPDESCIPYTHSLGPALDHRSLDHILRSEPGYAVRIRPDLGGRIWYKLEIRTAKWPRHYLIISLSSALPLAAGLAALSLKVDDFEAGTLRPSPDR